MADKISEAGVNGVKGTQDELYDVFERFEEVLKLQKRKVGDEILPFFSVCVDVQNIQGLRNNNLRELKHNVTEMKKCCNKQQIFKAEYEECYLGGKEECARLKEEEQVLRKELYDTRADVQSLKADVDHLYEEARPKREDAAILERNRDLLRHYKNLTGVKWDYTVPLSEHAGNVFNSANNYCNHFSYPAAKANADCVWDEIERASNVIWSDIN